MSTGRIVSLVVTRVTHSRGRGRDRLQGAEDESKSLAENREVCHIWLDG